MPDDGISTSSASTMAAPDATASDIAAPTESVETPAQGDSGLDNGAFDTPAAETEGQDAQTAPMDVAAARSLGLIQEHFGVNADILRDASPALVQALATQAEQALFDRMLTGTQPQPNQPQQGQLGQPEQPAGEFNIDFKPILEKIEQRYDKDLAEPVGEALTMLASEVRKQLAPFQQMQQAFVPMAKAWAGYMQAQEEQGIESFFGEIAKQPAWAPHLSGPQGQKLKADAVQFAYAFKQRADQAGQSMSGQEALRRGWLAATRELTNKQAIDAVRGQVQRRAKQITTPPGQATSAGRKPELDMSKLSARDRALYAMKQVEERAGMAGSTY